MGKQLIDLLVSLIFLLVSFLMAFIIWFRTDKFMQSENRIMDFYKKIYPEYLVSNNTRMSILIAKSASAFFLALSLFLFVITLIEAID